MCVCQVSREEGKEQVYLRFISRTFHTFLMCPLVSVIHCPGYHFGWLGTKIHLLGAVDISSSIEASFDRA